MIDITGYTCSICGADVLVEGIQNPKITWNCGHDGQTVHANLKGKLFGLNQIENGVLPETELPQMHRESFANKYPVKHGTFKIKDWFEYIDQYHKDVAQRSTNG